MKKNNKPKTRSKPEKKPIQHHAFVNNEGRVLWIKGDTKIPDLIKMGVRSITIDAPGATPVQGRNMYVHSSPP